MKRTIALLVALLTAASLSGSMVWAQDVQEETAVVAPGESEGEAQGESAGESQGESGTSAGSPADGLTEDTIAWVDPYDNGTGKNPPTENSYLVYMPVIEPNGAKSPVVVVMGEEQFTEETAWNAVEELGLEAFCKENQCYAVFLGPNGDSWDESDLVYYDEAVNLFGEVLIFRDMGLFTNAQFISSQDLIYVLAEGSAADFVCDYVLNADNTAVWADYNTPDFTFHFSHVPAGVFLSNPSNDGAGLKLRNIGVAAVVVNGKEELVQALVDADEATIQEENCFYNPQETFRKVVSVQSDVMEGFDSAALTDNLSVLLDAKRSEAGDSFPLDQNLNWDRLGIAEYKLTLDTGDGNTVHYQVYIPENLDTAQEGAYPLVLTFHGGGENADINLASTRYPILGKEEGFITIAVDQHAEEGTALNTENIDTFMEQIFADYPCIDHSRVYASGMSMGAGKTWMLGMLNTDYFAAVAPFHSIRFSYFADLGYENMDPVKEGAILPMFLTSGEVSTSPEFPTGDPDHEEHPDWTVGAILARNQVTDSYAYDPEADSFWGIAPQFEKETTYNDCYVVDKNYYKSEDGKIYTVFANISNEGHECHPFEAIEAWQFLKCFSRVDGQIVINDTDGYFAE